MDYFIKLIEALAWPITTLILVFSFHRQLSKLILRLSSFKYKDIEAIFEAGLQEIESEVPNLITDKPKIESSTLLSLPSANISVFDNLANLAEISPRAAVTEAWRHVEQTARGAASAAGIESSNMFPVRDVVQELVKENIFSKQSIHVFGKLKRLRNKAAHAPEFALDKNEAEKYIELALTLSENLYDAGNALGLDRGTRIIGKKQG